MCGISRKVNVSIDGGRGLAYLGMPLSLLSLNYLKLAEVCNSYQEGRKNIHGKMAVFSILGFVWILWMAPIASGSGGKILK